MSAKIWRDLGTILVASPRSRLGSSQQSIERCDRGASAQLPPQDQRLLPHPGQPVKQIADRLEWIMLEIDKFDLDEIALALSDQNVYDEHLHLVDPETGEIVLWTRAGGIDGETPVDLDDLDLVAIHPLPSYVWHEDMADFTELVSDDQAARRLARAINGRGAFRRFKDELHEDYPQLLPAWYGFRDARAARRAVDWLLDASLISHDAADTFRAEHPEPAVP